VNCVLPTHRLRSDIASSPDVQAGASFTLTSHGRPVAELVSISAAPRGSAGSRDPQRPEHRDLFARVIVAEALRRNLTTVICDTTSIDAAITPTLQA